MKKIKVFMLIINENCNLNCTYCYEHHKTNSYMSFATAKSIIDKELSTAKSDEIFEIEFFGGEPFLNFSLIKQVVEYVKTEYSHLKIYFNASTNGTLVHGEIKEWLIKNKDRFSPGLSLDGTKEMHDLNRPFRKNGKGSYDLIDIDFFKNQYREPHAKMTISPATLPKMAEGIKHIHNLGFVCDATFATGIDWTNLYNIEILCNQLAELIDFYKENPQLEVCRMLSYDFTSVLNPTIEKFRYCGAGKTTKAFDCQGIMYPCQGFAPVTLGKDEAMKYVGEDFSDFKFDKKSICAQCKLVNLCPTCYACNKASTGDIGKMDNDMCLLNRLCILAGAKIQYYRLIDQPEPSTETQRTLKAIEVLQKETFNPSSIYLNNFVFT